MGSDQNSWTPYNNKDCSLGLCSIYCPQFCYFIFPPPPPPDHGSASAFSPLIIAVIGVLASAFLLVTYYTVVIRYCTRAQSDPPPAGLWQSQAAAAGDGLEEAAIKAIAVCRYRRGDGLIEGAECVVCLSEFEEEERLRLLPKCSHAFHLPCIDTWLKSHSSCPMCRAAVVVVASPAADAESCESSEELVVVVDEVEEGVGGSGGGAAAKSPDWDGELRRSVSLGNVRVSVGEFGEDLGRKRCRSSRELSFT